MGDHLPPLDFSNAAYTGWTRAHWAALLARATYGFARQLNRAGSPARVLFPDDGFAGAGHSDAVNGLESFARLALAWGLWLYQPANPARLSFQGYDLNLAYLLQQGLLQGTNPASRYYWGDIGHLDQRLVECACLSIAVWLSRAQVFDQLTAAQQTQIVAWLAQADGKGAYPDNWVMFPAVSQVVRLRLGQAAPEADLRRRLEAMAAFYRGDGWYADGRGDEYDLYNAWMFGGHYLFWAWMDGDRFPDLRDEVLARARSFLAAFPHFFGANGSYVGWGRSLGSRFGALIAVALGHVLGVAPANPGLLRRLSSGNLRYYAERGLFHPSEHYLTQGVHGHNPLPLESYVSPGSPGSALAGLFALALDPADPFWTAPEAPLPVEREDFELALPAPGFVVSGRRATGQVTLLNSRAGVASTANGYPAKYGKLAYHTHFPFNAVSVHGGHGPDMLPALTADGAHFGHRTLTRRGGAAPGYIWSEFDEEVNGEPQAVRAAVLLWRDAQIVLAVIEPTLPVAAYYASAALGVERPAGLVRRSDPAAGWEYAEGEDRAVGVARLLGYDAQQASAPFLGRSTLNMAYPYSEHPLVYETRPRLAPRALAALSLARPQSFDPARELAGFSVTADRGVFAITCPDEEQMLLAQDPTLPMRFTLGGLTFEGAAVRYARALPEGRGCAGLGVEAVAGLVTFAAPATFALEHHADGATTLLTNAGARFATPPASVEVRSLTRDWQPAPDTSAASVRAWQAATERTLVEFRLRA
ncbi:MAG: DUF2264 domain-containing protein [Anaerolineales bacterium]|nr:DUF2264 domain-containing protein [Anaerolineales bacterium]